MGELKTFVEVFGIDWDLMLVAIGGVIVLTNAVKKLIPNLEGYWNLIPAVVVAFLVSLKLWTGVSDIAFATLILALAGSGTWESVKTVAHKLGNGKEAPK